MSKIDHVATVANSSDLHNDEMTRLRDQLWIGLQIITFIVLTITFISRRIIGDPIQPLSLAIQVMLHGIVIANIVLRNTKYIHLVQGIFTACIHIAVLPVFVLYGGTRGFGDVALLGSVVVTVLYGWRPWMFISYGMMVITLVWVLYRDGIGQPVTPLLTYSAQFTSLKFIILMIFMIFIMRYFNAFYHGLLDKYRDFANEQVHLNQELHRSRQKIVTAREEERRRLSRDLHDGLGPTLAAQMFRVGAAQQSLHNNPDKTAVLLNDLEEGIEQTLNSIRQLVYELRPPLLDQLGLVGAISDFVSRDESKLDIKLNFSDDLSQVNAAVEVAAFRILQTSLDNVIKHAQASSCNVELTITEGIFQMNIIDDGVGIARNYRAGVGLTSMRERVEELSGSFTIKNVKPHGSHLAVSIPLMLGLENTAK